MAHGWRGEYRQPLTPIRVIGWSLAILAGSAATAGVAVVAAVVWALIEAVQRS